MDRTSILIDPNIRLLCVTEDAGMGKSKCLEQIEYLRMQADPSHLCIRLDFAQLPESHLEYLDPQTSPWLLQLSGLTPSHLGNEVKELEELHQLLCRKIRTEQCTLLVDAMDQSANDGRWEGEEVAKRLAAFLKKHPSVRCVVSGRPFAIQFYWKNLFTEVGEPWELIQVDEFTQKEREAFLGEARANAIRHLKADLLAVPRSLETIRQREPEELKGIRTLSELYWLCHQRGFELGKADQPRDISIKEATALLSMIAFEQVRLGLFNGVADTPNAKMRYDNFVSNLYRQYRTWFAKTLDIRSLAAFEEKLGNLNALNIALDPGVLKTALGTDPNTPTCVQLVFRNRTLQDFYAALWITRFHSSERVQRWLASHLYQRGRYQHHFREGNRYEFWKLASEMPGTARNNRHFVRNLSVLFSRPCNEPETVQDFEATMPKLRSTEMIYRVWPHLLDIAELLPDRDLFADRIPIDEGEILKATNALQNEIHHRIKQGRVIQKTSLPKVMPLREPAKRQAKWLLERYLSEYPLLLAGRWGTDQDREVAQRFESEMRVIPSGAYWYGDEDEEPPVVCYQSHEFLLSPFPVTNELMLLFDRNHMDAGRFPIYSQYSRESRCPAIYCDWYTAWSASVWFGGYLPTEAEWERACRGDQRWRRVADGRYEMLDPPVRYQNGDTEADRDAVAWHNDNADNRTHAMGGQAEEKEDNSFEMYHMLGNVWEQTSSWWDENQDVRVVRGGSFFNRASLCRSGYRLYWPPSDASHDLGFRIARAPKTLGS